MKLEIKVQTWMKKATKHIYHRPIVAKHYDQSFARSVPTDSFNLWVSSMLQSFLPKSSAQFNVFEGGAGTGLFSFPIIKYLVKSDSRCFYFGIDNSKAMLNLLFGKDPIADFRKENGDKITIGFGDLDRPLCFPNSFFRVAILGGVLHCLNHVETTISQLSRVLARDGILIIVAKTDDSTRIQSGEEYFGPELNPAYMQFWKHYYDLRAAKNIVLDKRHRLVFDVKLIRDTLGPTLGDCFEYCGSSVFHWKANTCFHAMIRAIKYGLTFALGQGISYKVQKELSDEMTLWLEARGNLIEKIELEHRMEALIWKKIM
ncbi:MAG: hypothetical protein DKINENOH_01712 [bacterium]|nr:hypothetical protein [bacterium]